MRDVLPERPSYVLFACNLNSIRSPMAAALFRHFYGHSVRVDSVGVYKGVADPFVAEVMDEIGIDMSAHKPKSFAELEDRDFDTVVTLTPEAHHRAIELTRLKPVSIIYWPCVDPTAIEGSRDQILQAYRALRDDLTAHIRASFGPSQGALA